MSHFRRNFRMLDVRAQPERLAGDQYSIRSDVWSTGITLLELVQNRFPFPQDIAQIELMMLITQNEVDPPLCCATHVLTMETATRTRGRGRHRLQP